MSFWIQLWERQNQPDILQRTDFPHPGSADTQSNLDDLLFASLERAHEPQTTHMSLGFDLDFVLFVLGTRLVKLL
jgi:hypothetical protein